jgi:hypothetical protein
MKNDTCALGEGGASVAGSTFDSDDTARMSPSCFSAGRLLPARGLYLLFSEFFRVIAILNQGPVSMPVELSYATRIHRPSQCRTAPDPVPWTQLGALIDNRGDCHQ